MATIGSEAFGAKLGPIVGKMVRITADVFHDVALVRQTIRE